MYQYEYDCFLVVHDTDKDEYGLTEIDYGMDIGTVTVEEGPGAVLHVADENVFFDAGVASCLTEFLNEINAEHADMRILNTAAGPVRAGDMVEVTIRNDPSAEPRRSTVRHIIDNHSVYIDGFDFGHPNTADEFDPDADEIFFIKVLPEAPDP